MLGILVAEGLINVSMNTFWGLSDDGSVVKSTYLAEDLSLYFQHPHLAAHSCL